MAGIYIHVPFCHAKCAYCDFYSIARRELVPQYVESVVEEYGERRCELGGEAVETLYFGGGTPSILPPEALAEIVKVLPVNDLKEFTLEANPEDVRPTVLEAWRAVGVDRVSIGVQSLDDSELRAVGRRHTAAEALEAIANIKRAGIDNISGDLIFGLPGQSLDSFRRSLNELIATGITHLSAYCLSYEEGTTLWRKRQAGRLTPTDDDTLAAMYEELCRVADGAGFEHYEISNFALPGHRSRHNSSYWNSTPYLGLGPGAHSFGADGLRRYNTPDLRRWLANRADALTIEEESSTERANDVIMTGLRTAEGLDTERLEPRFASAVIDAAQADIAGGRLIADGRRLRIPESYFLVSDDIIRRLIIV